MTDQCPCRFFVSGFEVGDDNSCEKIEVKKKPDAPIVKRDEPAKPPKAAETKPEPSGQILCDMGGCRPVKKGCKLIPAVSGTGPAREQCS